jgi:hypothetical protein
MKTAVTRASRTLQSSLAPLWLIMAGMVALVAIMSIGRPA